MLYRFQIKLILCTIYALCSTVGTILAILLIFFIQQGDHIIYKKDILFLKPEKNNILQYKDYYHSMNADIVITGNFKFDFFLLNLIFIILFILYFYIFSQRIVQYGKEIYKGIERVKLGDFETKIQVIKEDEFGELAHSVNAIGDKFQQLMEKERMAEKTKRDLITSVAHDIRTPLTSVIGYLELLKQNDLTEETRRKYHSIVYHKAKRLQTLVGDLFDYIRYDKDGFTLNKQNIELNQFMEQILDEFYPSFQKNNLEYKVELEQEPIPVYADGELLFRAFGNLVSNAIRYGADGKLVCVKTERQDEVAIVSIKNFGNIIPKKELDKIFYKFYRVEQSRSTVTGGTGLGLAITKNIISLHNGKIQVQSDEYGTIFQVTLPIYDKEGVVYE